MAFLKNFHIGMNRGRVHMINGRQLREVHQTAGLTGQQREEFPENIYTFDMKKIMGISVALGIVFCFSGLWLSYSVRLASGASIVLVAVGSYALISLLRLGSHGKGGAHG